MTYGIKTSKLGVDVKTATELELTYNSEWNNWKIYSEGTTTLNVPENTGAGETGNVDITHSLGYVPAVELWAVDGTDIVCIPGPDTTIDYSFDFYIDSSKIRIFGTDGSMLGAKNFTIRYVIYYEKIL